MTQSTRAARTPVARKKREKRVKRMKGQREREREGSIDPSHFIRFASFDSDFGGEAGLDAGLDAGLQILDCITKTFGEKR